ncbi:MAG: DUF2007 domain-containing protein [Cyanobacteria bacterium P01_F01_bin.33]
MEWKPLREVSSRWEAEMLEQFLAGYGIPVRFRDVGMSAYFGSGAATTVLVRQSDADEAEQLLIATPVEEDPDA